MCPTNGVSPLDNMRTLEHYLNDMVRGTGGGAGGDHGKTPPPARLTAAGEERLWDTSHSGDEGISALSWLSELLEGPKVAM